MTRLLAVLLSLSLAGCASVRPVLAALPRPGGPVRIVLLPPAPNFHLPARPVPCSICGKH